jgi:hypothetical protein
MFQNASAPPHTRSEFYFFNLWAPTHVLQFDKAAMDAKTDAFLKHASQCDPPTARSKCIRSSQFRRPSPIQVLRFFCGFQNFAVHWIKHTALRAAANLRGRLSIIFVTVPRNKASYMIVTFFKRI